MQSYRFHSLTEDGAKELARALSEDGMRADVLAPVEGSPPGWNVMAYGDDRSEGLLEMLAQMYGGFYEGEGLAGA